MTIKKVRRLTALIVSLAMIMGMMPLNFGGITFKAIKAEAANTEAANTGDFSVVVSNQGNQGNQGNQSGYSYDNNVLTINGSGEYTISMATVGETTTKDIIKVTSNDDVTIILDSVLISSVTASPFEIDAKGDVTIKLKGESSFTVTSNSDIFSGLQKTSTDNELIITSIYGDGNTTGSLTASGNGAGIGGYNDGAGSNITIKGGTVTAEGNFGAGIGGGADGAGSNITIEGGTVTATGIYGAGIGGGGSYGSNIKITGGTVTATGKYGAGIGGGLSGDGSNITIEDGTVTAIGLSTGGAAIGGGTSGAGSDITISGGTVTAEVTVSFNSMQAVIGGGTSGAGSNITISGGTVTATATAGNDKYGAVIGGGRNGAGSNITISGGTVTATATAGNYNYGAVIGGGFNKAGSNITISGGTVTAEAAGNKNYGAVIGGGQNGSASGIYISPDKDSALNVKYAEDGDGVLYFDKKEISNNIENNANTYFYSQVYDIDSNISIVEVDSVGVDYNVIVSVYGGENERYLESVMVLEYDTDTGAIETHELEYYQKYEGGLNGNDAIVFPVSINNISDISNKTIYALVKTYENEDAENINEDTVYYLSTDYYTIEGGSVE